MKSAEERTDPFGTLGPKVNPKAVPQPEVWKPSADPRFEINQHGQLRTKVSPPKPVYYVDEADWGEFVDALINATTLRS